MADITPNTPNPVREDSYKTELATKLGIDAQYIPSSPVWRNEEEIAAIAEMFSNMTAGSSGGGVLVVNITWNDGGTIATLDKTWNEINSAGFNVALESDSGSDNYYMCSSIYTNPMDGTKQIDYIGNGGGGALTVMTFTAATASDYPTYNAE